MVGSGGLAAAAGLFLIFSKGSRTQRQLEADADAAFEQDRMQALNAGRVIAKNYQKRLDAYDRSTNELRKAVGHYRAEGDELKQVLKEHRHTHHDSFLRQHVIDEHLREIPGLTEPIVAMLESFGVETALDIDQLALAGIPNIDSTIVLELIQWRAGLERGFVFQPEHGVTEAQLQAAQQTATQRFKLVQARKVLMGAKQLDAMAHAGEVELKHALLRFDQMAASTRQHAKRLCEIQSNRRKLERLVNQSPQMVVTLMIAVAALGGLLWLMS